MKAAKAVEGLPEHLQGKAFELAVAMLSGANQGGETLARPAAPVRGATRHVGRDDDAEGPDVADLLRASKRNPDRYLAFMADLDAKGEPATTATLIDCFRTYRQDIPKLPARDLGDMVAKGWIEQVGKGRDASFALKRKGRDRLDQLAGHVE